MSASDEHMDEMREPDAMQGEGTRKAEEGALQAADAPAPAAPAPADSYNLGDLSVSIPTMRVKRRRGGRCDLSPDVVPTFSLDGKPVHGLERGRDYTIMFTNPLGEPLKSVQDEGYYRAVLRGKSARLSGHCVVAFDVKKSRRWLAVLLAFLAAAAIVAALVLTQCRSWYDPNAGNGLAGLSDTDIQSILDAKVAEGMMNITILTPIFFPDGSTQPGEAGFNNIEANHVDQKLVIKLADTDEVVYESGAIQPGQNIHYITLNRDLPPGNYAAIAAVTGYDPDTHEEAGTMNAEIILSVS